VTGGDDGNLWFNWAAMSWAKNVENTAWLGVGFQISSSFGIEVREVKVVSYAHPAICPEHIANKGHPIGKGHQASGALRPVTWLVGIIDECPPA
jgi:hypothetical protein